MYSFSNIITPQYWFSPPPVLSSLTLWLMVAVFGLMLAAAVVLNILSQKSKFDQPLRRGLKKISVLLGWLGAAGFILLFFRYEIIPFLSWRFWYGLWAIGLAIWLGFILKFWFKDIPRRRKDLTEKARLKKYLP